MFVTSYPEPATEPQPRVSPAITFPWLVLLLSGDLGAANHTIANHQSCRES